jgi:hypothetical protein
VGSFGIISGYRCSGSGPLTILLFLGRRQNLAFANKRMDSSSDDGKERVSASERLSSEREIKKNKT